MPSPVCVRLNEQVIRRGVAFDGVNSSGDVPQVFVGPMLPNEIPDSRSHPFVSVRRYRPPKIERATIVIFRQVAVPAILSDGRLSAEDEHQED